MTKEEKDSDSIIDYLKRLRENKGGAFSTEVLKHGGSVRAIAATAASQLKETMIKNKVEVLTYQRKALPNLFGDNAIDPPKAGKPPTLKRSVVEHLAKRGIGVKYSKGLIDFWKIEPKK